MMKELISCTNEKWKDNIEIQETIHNFYCSARIVNYCEIYYTFKYKDIKLLCSSSIISQSLSCYFSFELIKYDTSTIDKRFIYRLWIDPGISEETFIHACLTWLIHNIRIGKNIMFEQIIEGIDK